MGKPYFPNAELIREPRLLVPGLQPLGQVQLANAELFDGSNTAVWLLGPGLRSVGGGGRLTNYVGAPTPGIYGGEPASNFGANNAYQIPNAGVMKPTGAFTVFAKVRRVTTAVDLSGIIRSPLNGVNEAGWFLGARNDNKIYFYRFQVSWAYGYTAALSDANRWYWAIATHNPSDDKFRLYLDDVYQWISSAGPWADYGNTQPPTIGEYGGIEWAGDIAVAGITHKYWNADMVRRFVSNPYQFLIPA